MRAVFYTLLALNVAYLTWAVWIDSPPAQREISSEFKVPQLTLASEAKANSKTRTAGVESKAPHCMTVGPFDSAERVANARTLLEQRGLQPRRREEQGEAADDGYWVYVGGLRTAFDQARVIRTLDQAGLSDAQIMPETKEEGRRVSVGLFSERERAERRARVVLRLGLEPKISERRVPTTIYWLNVDLQPDQDALSADELSSADQAGARLEVKDCPAGEPAGSGG